MGHNLRRNFQAPASDYLACLNELTQTNSDSSASGVIIERLVRDPTANETPGETMVWTNEKHNSYLEILEASFVKQLHYSMSLRGCREEMWEPRPTPQLPAELHNSSHQFSALQDCCYRKSNDPLLDSTADSSDIRESRLHRFTCAGKSSTETVPLSRETMIPDGGTLRDNMTLGGCTNAKSILNLLEIFLLPISFIHFCYEFPHSMLTDVDFCIALSDIHASFLFNQSIWPLTEASDQNFVDENQREKTSRVSRANRLKRSRMHDASTK